MNFSLEMIEIYVQYGEPKETHPLKTIIYTICFWCNFSLHYIKKNTKPESSNELQSTDSQNKSKWKIEENIQQIICVLNEVWSLV